MEPANNRNTRLSREQVDQLADDIAIAAAHIDAATHQLLSSIRRFDACGGWYRQGAKSCAHWLSWRIGLGVNAAREKVRVARRLGELELIDGALRDGVVSFSKVRAMTRVATAENEAKLLVMAKSSTGAQLERICRGYRQVMEPRKARQDDERRYVRKRHTRSGMVRIEAQLRPDEAALVMQALGEMRGVARSCACCGDDGGAEGKITAVTCGHGTERTTAAEITTVTFPGVADQIEAAAEITAVTSLHDNGQGKSAAEITAVTSLDPEHDTPTPNLADGLVLMAESVLATGPAARRAGERNQLLVQLSEERLDTGELGSWRAELHDGSWLSGPSLMRLVCDASVTVVKTAADGSILDVGRKRRTIPPAMWTALLARDGGGCRFPGCCSRIFLAAHHIEHWAQGGHTKLDNLVLVCGHHHERLHEGGFQVERRADGTLVFITPDGELIEPAPAPPTVTGEALQVITADHQAQGLHIDRKTSLPNWFGDPLDLGAAVGVLLPRHDGP